MQKIKIAISIILLLVFVAWKVVWWYEDRKLEEQKLEELILHVNEPSLKDMEILDFYGTHEGWEWQDGNVARFIFYSKHNIKFTHMEKKFAVPFDESQGVFFAKKAIEKDIGQDIDDLRGVYVNYRLIDEEYQIVVFVTETARGFYAQVEMIELR